MNDSAPWPQSPRIRPKYWIEALPDFGAPAELRINSASAVAWSASDAVSCFVHRRGNGSPQRVSGNRNTRADNSQNQRIFSGRSAGLVIPEFLKDRHFYLPLVAHRTNARPLAKSSGAGASTFFATLSAYRHLFRKKPIPSDCTKVTRKGRAKSMLQF